MSVGLAALRDLSSRSGAFVNQSLVVAHAEVLKLHHDPTELITRAVQPVLWLIIFGEVMARIHGIPTGTLGYLDFLTPGILAQSSLFVAIFYGINVIWERDLGILVKYIASPAARGALVLGKGLAAGIRGLSQAVIIFAVAAILGVRLNFTPFSIGVVVLAILLGAAIFCTFSLIIACIVKTRDRFMGIGQILTMPLFFASNAIYPITLMPAWLGTIARFNPLTYQVDALRSVMLRGAESSLGLGLDLSVMTAALVLLLSIAARMYPTILY
jgi:ABC-2 type transport system permease protein